MSNDGSDNPFPFSQVGAQDAEETDLHMTLPRWVLLKHEDMFYASLKHENAEPNPVGLGWRLEFCTSNKPQDVDVTGPQATLWVVMTEVTAEKALPASDSAERKVASPLSLFHSSTREHMPIKLQERPWESENSPT